MSGGGIFLSGQWLAVGTRVVILRPGYAGMCGLFKGKTTNNKLLVNVEGAAIALHVKPCEIRRVQATPNDPRVVRK